MSHDEWESLAVGHALHALEPAEEERLADHLADCADCARAVAEGERVAADIGLLAGPAEPPPHLWDRIQGSLGSPRPSAARAVTGSATAQTSVDTTPLGARRRARRARGPVTAVAAALVVLAGVAGWQVAARTGGSSSPLQERIAACRQAADCRVFDLASSGRRAAVMLVDGDRAHVVATGLPAVGANATYVLWQLPRNGAPTGVAAFDRRITAVLPLPLARTAAFAISREPGRSVPPEPTRVVATAPVS